MQQFCQYGSVRGATGNRRPYRDIHPHRPTEPIQSATSTSAAERKLGITLRQRRASSAIS